VLLVGGALTVNVPESQRLVSGTVPAAAFVALGLRQVGRGLAQVFGLGAGSLRALAAAAVAVIAAINLHVYFDVYQSTWTYGSLNGEVATRLGYYLRDLGPGWRYYFFGAPRMGTDFATIPFLAKGVPGIDVRDPLTGVPRFVDPSVGAVFVFVPERRADLRWVQEAYPNGTLEELHRVGPPGGPVLFTAYRVDRSALAAR